MQLQVVRDQEQVKGMFGGNKGAKFKIAVKVLLSPEESALVQKYKVDSEPLLHTTLRFFGREVPVEMNIGDLVRGKSFETQSIGEIIAIENEVKSACQGFANVLAVMSNFGGTETIDL